MKPRIKKIIKRILLGILLLMILVGILGLIFYKDVKQWMIAEAEKYLAELPYGDLEITSMDFALFHDLPNITIKLQDVYFYEQKDSLRTPDQSPILYAGKIYLAFEPLELIRNNRLVVTYASIQDGVLDLYTYEDDKTNLERAFLKPTIPKKKPKKLDSAAVTPQKANPPLKKVNETKKQPDSIADTPKTTRPPEKTVAKKSNPVGEPENFEIALQDIHLKNIQLNYANPHENYSSQVILESVEGEIFLKDTGLSCDLATAFEITESSKLSTLKSLGPAFLELSLDFEEHTGTLVIHKGALRFQQIDFALQGSYSHRKAQSIDIEFDASSSDLAILSKLIQEDILAQNRASVNDADVVLKGRIKGELEDNIPTIDLEFALKDLSVKGPAGGIDLKNVGFEGTFTSGEPDDFSRAELNLRGIRGQTTGGQVSGSFYLRDFQRPYIKTDLTASLDLHGYDEIFHLKKLDSLEGRIAFHSDFDGLLNLDDGHEMDSIGSWSLLLEDLAFYYLPFEKKIHRLDGAISATQNEIKVTDFTIQYDSSDLSLNGHIKNLYHFIFNKEQDIEAEVDLRSSQWYTAHLVTNPSKKATIDDRISNLLLRAQLVGRDNDTYDSFFPKFHLQLVNLSMDLDKLPSITNLEGVFDFEESEKGFQIGIEALKGDLPVGAVDLNGAVRIPPDFKTLTLAAQLGVDNLPQEYLQELVRALGQKPLLDAKRLEANEMTLFNGNLDVSSVLELMPFGLHDTHIRQSNLTVSTRDTVQFNLDNLTVDMDALHFQREQGTRKITGIQHAEGSLNWDALTTPVFPNTPLDLTFNVKEDSLQMEFSTSGENESRDTGFLTMDLSQSPPPLKLKYNWNAVSLASVVEDYTDEKLMEGTIDVSLDISATGSSLEEIEENLEGFISIRGDSLWLYGLDLDDLLRKYKRSQKFNLADVSAYVVAGPFGAAVTKGADFTSLISADLKPQDQTQITQALVRWRLENGVLKTDDVAFNTLENRVAIQGEIDYANDSIPGLTVYVVDKKGCSLMQQRVYGRTSDLQLGELKIAKTLLGSVINLVNSLVGKNCEPVYTGSIAHPEISK